jgi:hypothetical protein
VSELVGKAEAAVLGLEKASELESVWVAAAWAKASATEEWELAAAALSQSLSR